MEKISTVNLEPVELRSVSKFTCRLLNCNKFLYIYFSKVFKKEKLKKN